MYLGRIVEIGPTQGIYNSPLHPYTQSLLAAIPKINGRRVVETFWLRGEPPDAGNLPSGCRFQSRCPHCTALCRTEDPALKQPRVDAAQPGGDGTRLVACHFAGNVKPPVSN
jgi:oligopeptide/dipeptide ABC transporter ATP-binding protein